MVTATSIPRRTTAGRAVTVLLLVAAVVVAGAINTVVAFGALAAGADASFAPLMPAVYLPFTLLGVAAGYLGWRIVRARAAHPLRALRVLVPVLLLASLIPDLVLLLTGFIPGTTVVGAVGLMLMHPVTVAVAVPVFQRLAPVRS